MQLSIKDYASLRSISLQAVYQAIKKGKLKTVSKDGKKFVIVDASELKQVDQPDNNQDNKQLIKDLLKQLKRKDKEIKALTKKLIKCSRSKEEVLIQYIQELKQLQLPSPDPVDVKVKKKKKK
jgi:hypothetical protein